MAALKIFGRQKKERKPAESPKGIQAGPPQSSKAGLGGKAAGGMSAHIVSPHITEKATDLAAKNQYVFLVSPHANKRDIKRSVEKMYGVDVRLVRVVNVHSKKMRLGRIQGIKKGYKKAMVKLAEGQKIEILPT